MDSPLPLSPKALRKLQRKAQNDLFSKEARFWKAPNTAIQLGNDKPVNRQAARDLGRKAGPRPRP